MRLSVRPKVFAHLESLGNGSLLEGVITGIEERFQGRISDSAYDLERRLNAGQRITVGVNDFQAEDEEDQSAARDHQRR